MYSSKSAFDVDLEKKLIMCYWITSINPVIFFLPICRLRK